MLKTSMPPKFERHLIERRIALAMLSAQLRHRHTAPGLLEKRQDPAVAESQCLHLESPSPTLREDSNPEHFAFSGELPQQLDFGAQKSNSLQLLFCRRRGNLPAHQRSKHCIQSHSSKHRIQSHSSERSWQQSFRVRWCW
jgi:hypothetical protein